MLATGRSNNATRWDIKNPGKIREPQEQVSVFVTWRQWPSLGSLTRRLNIGALHVNRDGIGVAGVGEAPHPAGLGPGEFALALETGGNKQVRRLARYLEVEHTLLQSGFAGALAVDNILLAQRKQGFVPAEHVVRVILRVISERPV